MTAGSRGIHDLVPVVRAAVDWLRAAGAEPFVVPAMGSHGGATADGQREMLAGLGVTPESVGCPIEATMETVVLGTWKTVLRCITTRWRPRPTACC